MLLYGKGAFLIVREDDFLPIKFHCLVCGDGTDNAAPGRCCGI